MPGASTLTEIRILISSVPLSLTATRLYMPGTKTFGDIPINGYVTPTRRRGISTGPGAFFWMWVIALLGEVSAFVESTLGQAYKTKFKGSGEFVGGLAYYI